MTSLKVMCTDRCVCICEFKLWNEILKIHKYKTAYSRTFLRQNTIAKDLLFVVYTVSKEAMHILPLSGLPCVDLAYVCGLMCACVWIAVSMDLSRARIRVCVCVCGCVCVCVCVCVIKELSIQKRRGNFLKLSMWV